MSDRLVPHADIVAIKGNSYWLKNRDRGPTPPVEKTNRPTEGTSSKEKRGVHVRPASTLWRLIIWGRPRVMA